MNPSTGALTSVGARSDAYVPLPGGIGFPFKFTATGTSPVWQSNCTHGCALIGFLEASGGGGGGNPPTNPNPPTSHYLSVTQGPFFGLVTSSPAGIDYGPATHLDPIGDTRSANHFPANSTVRLCASEPLQPQQAYDQHWSGSCSGVGQCASVTMTSDKSCRVTFTPVSAR